MNAEILAVGTELLMGQIANTNAQYISRRLNDLGINVYYHSVVGDNPDRLKKGLLLALARSDVVITTGGLGPTKDDLTKETISEVLDKRLVFNPEIQGKIEVFFMRLHKKMALNNTKQAYFPEGSLIIPNNNGTAPGCIVEGGDKTVIMLPGPPKEMCPMFEETVFPYFEKKTNQVIASRMLKVFGIGESSLECKIMDLIESQTNPTIAPYVKQGEITLRVTAGCNNCEDADGLIEPVIEKIRDRIGDCLYATNGEAMEEVVFALLKKHGYTMATAESCTGGMLGSMLVNVPGISQVYNRGFVTYSNQSKNEELGVSYATLDKCGAVSKETAEAMALGLKAKSGADVCVAITGIAGPDGGTEDKPVGLVFLSAMVGDAIFTERLNLIGDRERIRHVTCLHALDLVRKKLL